MFFILGAILDVYQPSPLWANFPGEDVVSCQKDGGKHNVTGSRCFTQTKRPNALLCGAAIYRQLQQLQH